MNQLKTEVRRGRPKIHDKERILEIAMRAYWEEEFASTSVNTICKLAGVAKPSLYRDFGSEDGLTTAVLELYASRVLVRVGEILSSDASFAAKLGALIHFASEDPQMETGCLFVKMRSGRSRYGEQTQAKLATLETQSLGLIVRFFEESRERQEWSGNISVELAARYLMEQLALAVTQRAAGNSRERVRELFTLSLSVLQQV